MCGIAGYFGKSNLGTEKIDACLFSMRHRGPDDIGTSIEKTRDGRNLYFLHTRLSIIDLERRARQPYKTRSGFLCYNGEIYNYRELRKRLVAEGAELHTESDTEVLAEILNRYGLEGISYCEGMWAFAWFDTVHEKLYLCRDRFGEKPLFVYEDETGVYFGSEPKFIFELLGRKLEVNQNQIRRYLVNGYKALYKCDDTFFEGMLEVPAASYRSYGREVQASANYWIPDFEAQDDSMSYADAVAQTRDALIRSVDLRLRSDVPIAFCLSGGVDSNALVAIAKRQLGYDVHGFTILNTDLRYEERDMVDVAVKELGLRHTEVPIDTNNFLENLRTLIKHHDAPIYTITYYAQWRLMQAVHEAGYKVSISGTGADELFSGYFDHHNAYLAAMKMESQTRYHEALNNWSTMVAPHVRNPFLKDPEYLVNSPDGRDHIYLDANVFSSMLRHPFVEPFDEIVYSTTLLRNRMANELRHESVPVILHEDDLNAMYFSIENRSPFLDNLLFEVCQTIPTRHLIRGGRAKAILRDAVREIAPQVVIDNPRKVGFNVPLFDYLNTNDPAVRAEILDDSLIYEIVKRSEIESVLSQSELTNSRSKFLFNFICAKIFLEEYAA